MDWKRILNWKLLILAVILFGVSNLLFIVSHNYFAETYTGQCMGGKQCDDWCNSGIDSYIEDAGKVKDLMASEAPCCCSIYDKESYFSILINPIYIIIIYVLVLAISLIVNKFRIAKK